MDNGIGKDQQIDSGLSVYDARGEWVGIVALTNTPGPSLVVQKGRWFPKNIQLPASTVDRVDDEGVYLRLLKKEV